LDSPLPPRSRRFRRNLRFLPNAVPRLTCANRVHPLVSFAPLQSPPVPCPPHTSQCEAPSMGFAVPLRDISPRCPCSKGSSPAAVPSSTFLTSPTVCSTTDLVGLFHPTATSRVHPSGFCSSRTAGPPRRRPVPSRRLAEVRYRQLPTGATFLCPALRALIHARVRCHFAGV